MSAVVALFGVQKVAVTVLVHMCVMVGGQHLLCQDARYTSSVSQHHHIAPSCRYSTLVWGGREMHCQTATNSQTETYVIS